MKTTLRPIVLATAIALAAPMAAQAEFSANIGVTSNYIFRGVTQTNDAAAVSGGLDYANDSGIYAGTWISNVDYGNPGNQYEQDWYLGYGFKAGGVDLDAGYIKFTYPIRNVNLDYDEIYLNASMGAFNGGFAYTVRKEGNPAKENDIYFHLGAEFEVKKGVVVGVTVGRYDYDDDVANTDYSHGQLSVSKDDFTLAMDKNNLSGAAGDARFSVSWSKAFDF